MWLRKHNTHQKQLSEKRKSYVLWLFAEREGTRIMMYGNYLDIVFVLPGKCLNTNNTAFWWRMTVIKRDKRYKRPTIWKTRCIKARGRTEKWKTNVGMPVWLWKNKGGSGGRISKRQNQILRVFTKWKRKKKPENCKRSDRTAVWQTRGLKTDRGTKESVCTVGVSVWLR